MFLPELDAESGKNAVSLMIESIVLFGFSKKKQQLIDVGAARSRQQPVRLKVSLAMHRLHTMPLGVVELIWWFPEIGVPPKSSIFMACSHIYTIHFGVITHFRKPPFEF